MIRWFAAHPTAANLLLIILLAMGAFAAPSLDRETFPDYRPVEASIEVPYRGASSADSEQDICGRLHDGMQGVEDLEELTCTAAPGRARSVATMREGGDAVRFINQIRTEAEALTDLPDRADPPVVRELHRSDRVAAVAVTGALPRDRLEDFAYRLEDRIRALPGIADVTLQGVAQRQWQVTVPREVLARHGLSARDLAARLERQNTDQPLGTLETRDRNIRLRFTDQRSTLKELEELVIVADPAGGELTLGSIANITQASEPEERTIRFNGEPAVVLEVDKHLRADSLQVMDTLENLIASEEQRFGDKLELTVTQDLTSIVRDRLTMLVKNGILGLLLVFGVMSLFFRSRMAFWAVLGLPVAFMGAIFGMAVTGLSLNMITLVALLMAIGIVMDDAVVIVDRIATHARAGEPPLTAVTDGTREVLPGVLSSFLTTVAVFGPLAFLAGELGAVLEVLPIVLVAALAASLIEAFWILPHHLKGGISRLREDHDSRLRRGFERWFESLQERIARLATGAIGHRYLLLAGLLTAALGTIGLLAGGHIGSEAMPATEGDVLEARILMPAGTPLERTEAVAGRIETAMQRLDQRLSPEQPGGASLVRSIQTRFDYHPGVDEGGPHVATIMVDLLTAEQRRVDLEQLTTAWQEAIGTVPGLHRLTIGEPGFGPAGVPIAIRLQGSDLNALQAAARDASEHLAEYGATRNVHHDLYPGQPQRSLSLAPGAHALGLTADDVASQLRTTWLGRIADTQRIDQRDIEITIRAPEADSNSLDDLSEQTISLPDGNEVPLGEVVEIRKDRPWASITHVDGRRTVTVEADVNARESSGQAIVSHLQRSGWLTGFQQRHPGVDVTFEGQTARSAETGASIARGLLIGMVAVFVILSFQFRSYLEPLMVMLTIPLALLGAVWGHVLTGYSLSMPSLVGAAGLAGIAVNDAILLIQFIKRHRGQGVPPAEAAARASRERLRAILITSSTTIAGLLPLLMETSTQAASIKPLVISVVFGLLTITALVLLVIPALYVIFDDLGWTATPRSTDSEPASA